MEPSVVRQPRPGGSNPFSAAKLSRTGGSAQILEMVPAIGTVRTRPRLGLPGTLTQRMDCALHPGQKTVGTVRCARRCSFFLSANRSGQFSTTLRGTVSGARVPGWCFHPGKTTIWIATRSGVSSSEIYELTRALAPLAVIVVGRTETDFRFALNAASLVNHTDLLQLIWLLRRASFVISVDSGPMHLAAAISRQLLSIHFWSDPKQVGPYRQDAWVWQNGRICRIRDLESHAVQPASVVRPHPIQIGAFVQEQLLQTP